MPITRFLRWIGAFAVALALGAGVATAADESDPEQGIATAPVTVDGAVLFRVRGVSSFPADQRAAGIAARIEQVAADHAIDAASVRMEVDGAFIAIYAGPTRIMVITPADARLEQLAPGTLAQANQTRIRSAIVEYRAARTSEHLTGAGLRTLGATLVFAAAVALILWLTRRLSSTIERDVHARIHTVGIQSFEIVRAERLRAAVSALLKGASMVALAILGFSWLVYDLGQFPWTVGAGNALLAHVLAPLSALGYGILRAIPSLIFLVVLYYIVRMVLRIVRMFFVAVERGTVALSGFESEWAMPTYKIVRFAIIALSLVVAYPYIPGSDSAAFKGVSLFVGVVFSLGSSTAVSNIIAGYMMTYRRAFRVGDRVKIGDITGDVTAMRLQVTHLRTPKNEEVVVPNSQIINGHVINYSTLAKKDSLLLHTTVGIGYETPWRQVEAMLLESARRTAGLTVAPAPFVLQTALGDFAVTYEINVGCDDPQQMPALYSALHRNILDVFNEYDVAIMTPAYVADPPEAKVVPKSKWHLPPAAPGGG